jgi:O-antigen/teichoic acid export membrane protein
VSEIVNESLKKAAKGTAIAFVGMLIYMFLEFITRVIIARNATQSEYGIFSIGFVLLNFFVIISCLGLHVGAPRYIAYFRGKGDGKKVKGVISSTVQLSVIASLFCFVLFFMVSDCFATLFHLQQSSILKIFAIAVPFAVTIEILASIFRGFDRVHEKVYFQDMLMNVLKVLFILYVIILGYSFLEMIYAYILSIVIASVAFIIYTIKKLPVVRNANNTAYPMRKELLLFSLPLLATNALSIIIIWMDTLMLGYFKTADVVGLYNAAHPIAQLIEIFLLSLVFIYVPITSQLYAKNLIEEMRRNYIILTKWIVSATLPFFLIISLFPEAILNALFGPTYMQADVTLALRILAIGMFVHVFLGPNAATLIVMGKTKLNLIDNLIVAIMNVSLNLLLIPTYGIVGAAIASMISFVAINALKSAQIFHIHRIHPFARNYLKTMVTSAVLVSLIYVLVKVFWSPTITPVMLVALGILFFALYGLSILTTKSFDQEDRAMLLELEKMTGIDASWIKRILKRFV